MKVTVSLAVVVASALAASAKPSDSFMGALLGRQQDQDLHARGTVDPSSIAPSCQSSCTNIVKTLDVRISFKCVACHPIADCFCFVTRTCVCLYLFILCFL
jgi:hypothetical protein